MTESVSRQSSGAGPGPGRRGPDGIWPITRSTSARCWASCWARSSVPVPRSQRDADQVYGPPQFSGAGHRGFGPPPRRGDVSACRRGGPSPAPPARRPRCRPEDDIDVVQTLLGHTSQGFPDRLPARPGTGTNAEAVAQVSSNPRQSNGRLTTSPGPHRRRPVLHQAITLPGREDRALPRRNNLLHHEVRQGLPGESFLDGAPVLRERVALPKGDRRQPRTADPRNRSTPNAGHLGQETVGEHEHQVMILITGVSRVRHTCRAR